MNTAEASKVKLAVKGEPLKPKAVKRKVVQDGSEVEDEYPAPKGKGKQARAPPIIEVEDESHSEEELDDGSEKRKGKRPISGHVEKIGNVSTDQCT
jgi:hypothetical protein